MFPKAKFNKFNNFQQRSTHQNLKLKIPIDELKLEFMTLEGHLNNYVSYGLYKCLFPCVYIIGPTENTKSVNKYKKLSFKDKTKLYETIQTIIDQATHKLSFSIRVAHIVCEEGKCTFAPQKQLTHEDCKQLETKINKLLQHFNESLNIMDLKMYDIRVVTIEDKKNKIFYLPCLSQDDVNSNKE